jgi:large subunit ribosomal protein L4
MLKAKLYNQEGKEVKTIDLPKSVFGIQPKEQVIHQVVVAQQNNSRQVLAHAKGRAEVRGGGRKPWRQKGTGRARHGSTRSPIWVGGGVTFGPTKVRNFSKRVNKKMKKTALFMVLSDRLAADEIKFVDKIDFPKIKTKKAVDLIKKLKAGDNILIVVEKTDHNLIKSCQNLPKVSVIRADSLNVVDLLKYKKLLITEKAVESLVKVYLEKSIKDEKPKEKKVQKVKKTVKKASVKAKVKARSKK